MSPRRRAAAVALALVALVVAPLLLESATQCHVKEEGGSGIPNDQAEGSCPVKLTSGLTPAASGGVYSECVTVRVALRADDFSKAPKIEVLSSGLTSELQIISPILKKRKQIKCDNQRRPGVTCVKCHGGRGRDGIALWELVHNCVEAEADAVVSASFITRERSCSVSYKVPDPVPHFDLSVNQSSKSISVTVQPGDKVHARWCYRKYGTVCTAKAPPPPITIDSSVSRVALLAVPYLLPCVCVQVYYARTDSKRRVKCPFLTQSLSDVGDVWLSSSVTLREASATWSSPCAARDLELSASLCWRRREQLCTPVLNSTLEEMGDGADLVVNTSAVDKHPQMCLRFSLPGGEHISCPFDADMSSWEVTLGPGRRSVYLYLSSSVPAAFSAQLCVPRGRGCSPVGRVHSATTENNSADATINVPLLLVAEEPCVQVWRSHPALLGRRVLCPDYTHLRWGLVAVAAPVFLVIVALLGVLIRRLAKSGAAGWLCVQEPVLLVCSSERSAHISAACSLASILQGDLGAKVHMASWAQSSQTPAGTGVADLGPLPWLYGRWEAVRRARGKVLIVWSPEATRAYAAWREERATRAEKDGRTKADDGGGAEETSAEAGEESKWNGRRGKGEGAAGREERDIQRESSTVTAAVFAAALACLEAALQEGKGQGVALVYFQGLCHRRDIPKAFGGVPRYRLPRDFRGLIQELGGMRRPAESCWPRLLAKALSVRLAQRLTGRLRALLPRRRKTAEPGASGAAGSGREREPLRGAPRLAEEEEEL
ncbi:uncharacterized protein LOC130198994 isoform X2 [Pseudoliparis swirei]|uniref:uncharacterized protein LOC130198994 isoform X2 n=1 Tax=Pseudoliparis swirei TaxID=2059687 RepID=UPI0024BDB8BB|nr:uncharacterized protein LOC130198994 isoform X2 [Pseudoliparis swirei]